MKRSVQNIAHFHTLSYRTIKLTSKSTMNEPSLGNDNPYNGFLKDLISQSVESK